MRKGVIFATYSSLIGERSSGGKYRTRFNQLLHWLGPHFEGVVSSVLHGKVKGSNSIPRLQFSFLTLKSEDVWGEP